ncbi:MAG: hypothetical protein WCE38_00790 [Burkholderiales bacterium]
MNGYRWRAATTELAELVRTGAPRIARVGAVMLVVLAVPLVLRYWMFLPR